MGIGSQKPIEKYVTPTLNSLNLNDVRTEMFVSQIVNIVENKNLIKIKEKKTFTYTIRFAVVVPANRLIPNIQSSI